MNISRNSALSAAVLFALTTGAAAGPLTVSGASTLAPTAQGQVETVAYRHYRHYRPYHHRHYRPYRHHRRYYSGNPGAAAAGAALGVLSLPFAAVGACDPYYGCGY